MAASPAVTKSDLDEVIWHFDRRIDALVKVVNDLAQLERALVKASNAVSAHEVQLEQRFSKVERQVNETQRAMTDRLNGVRNEVLLAIT